MVKKIQDEIAEFEPQLSPNPLKTLTIDFSPERHTVSGM